MNLHRADKQPQWESIALRDRNVAQKVGAATNGIVTPGNVISVAGAGLVGAGYIDIVKGKTRKGFAKVIVGRLADLLDGYFAEKTGTKSPIGETTDVVVDKAELAVGAPLLVAKGIVPKSFGVAAGIQLATSAYYTKKAKDAGNEIHPIREGKYSTFLQWAAIGAYGISTVMNETSEDSRTAAVVECGADIIAAASVVLGVMSVARYRQDALAQTPADLPLVMST